MDAIEFPRGEEGRTIPLVSVTRSLSIIFDL